MYKKLEEDKARSSVKISDENVQLILDEIYETIEHNVKNNNSPPTLKRILQINGLILSLSAGVPFMTIAQQFAKNNLIYGYCLAGGTVICYANVCAWAYINLFEKLFEESEASRKLFNKSKKQKIAKWLAASFLAVSSTASSMYLAYSYNNKEILWPILNLLSSFGLRCYGFLTLIDKIELFKASDLMFWRKTQEHELRKIKLDLTQKYEYFSNSIHCLNTLNDERLSLDNKEIFIDEMLSIVQKLSLECKLDQACLKQFFKTLVQFFGGLLPSAQIALNSLMAFYASKMIFDHPIFGVFFCLITVMPEAVLQIISGRTSLGHIYDLISAFFNKSDLGRSALYYNPALAAFLAIFVLVISAFSYGAGAQAISDNFSIEDSKVLLSVFISADTLFHLYILSVNSSRFITKLSSIFGNENTKSLLNKSYLMSFFSNIFMQLSDAKFNLLLNSSSKCANNDGNEHSRIYSKENRYTHFLTYNSANQNTITKSDVEEISIDETYVERESCCVLL
jgi:hypothetical protein